MQKGVRILLQEKFLKSVLDQSKDYPLPVPVINLVCNGETFPLLTLKSFSLWQGKAKSKKTTVLALAIADFLRPAKLNNIYFEGMCHGVALFFDTEQGESYAARTMKLILKIMGVATCPNLIYSDLRGCSPEESLKIIEAGIKNTPNSRIVVIDGLVDLLNDFMDASEGHSIVTNIIQWCSAHNVHIAGVLHQNKADKNARAHIGSIASQKCEMEISTEVDITDRHRSIIECINSRGLSFPSFAIRWDKGSLPGICQDWSANNVVDAKATKNKSQIKEMADFVFKPLAAVRQSDAIEGIMNASMKSESTAKRHLKDLLIWGIVIKGADGLYRINLDGKNKNNHE